MIPSISCAYTDSLDLSGEEFRTAAAISCVFGVSAVLRAGTAIRFFLLVSVAGGGAMWAWAAQICDSS